MHRMALPNYKKQKESFVVVPQIKHHWQGYYMGDQYTSLISIYKIGVLPIFTADIGPSMLYSVTGAIKYHRLMVADDLIEMSFVFPNHNVLNFMKLTR